MPPPFARPDTRRLGSLAVSVVLLLGLAASAAGAASRKGPGVSPEKLRRLAARPMAAQAILTATNGILTVDIQDAGVNIGIFTIRTGASHPQPGETVFFPLGTSWITLRDATALIMWVNAGSFGTPAAGLAGYSVSLMSSQPAAVTTLGTTGFRTTFTLPNFIVVQDVEILGTTISDTSVRHSVTVTNRSTEAARLFGLRYMWDWEIAGNDASFFKPRNPDGVFTDTFVTFAPPAFQLFEEVDDTTTPTFSVFGTVMGGSLVPAPTAPEQLRYSSWEEANDFAWDFTNTGSAIDSSTEHYWGFNTPLTLGAGLSQAFVQYVSTVFGAVGQPTATPTGTAPPSLTPTGTAPPSLTPTSTATPTRTSTPVGGAVSNIPTLSASMLGLLCLALVAAAFVLMRR